MGRLFQHEICVPIYYSVSCPPGRLAISDTANVTSGRFSLSNLSRRLCHSLKSTALKQPNAIYVAENWTFYMLGKCLVTNQNH
jgi:hypothetical protein